MLPTAQVLGTDDQLASQIVRQLAGTNRANLKRLAVDVREGSVTLRGRVASFYEKQIAIEACRLRADLGRLIDAVEVVDWCLQ
jgi:osmotically-inducible protein OsmY